MSKVSEKSPIDWNALNGRSVIVTGGASGLGEGTVEKFAEHGAYVTIADVQEERGKELAARLSGEGKHVTFVKCDTSEWASSAAAFKHAVNFAPSKTLDVALLFAGMSGVPKSLVDTVKEHPEPTLEGDPSPQSPPKVLDVNLNGVYLSTWLALHYFRLPSATGSNWKKSLVTVSSLAGYMDQPYATAYSMSKHGVRGMFRSIRSEVHKVNARVNNIAPGYILTPLTMVNHGIKSPDEPSKILGVVLPWAPLQYAVEAAGRCAVNDSLDGRTLAILSSGVIDIDESSEQLTRLTKEEFADKIAELNPKGRI